jgi:hypothetical protein
LVRAGDCGGVGDLLAVSDLLTVVDLLTVGERDLARVRIGVMTSKYIGGSNSIQMVHTSSYIVLNGMNISTSIAFEVETAPQMTSGPTLVTGSDLK